MEARQNTDLKPCRVCVDFYGSAETDYLCSKCSREQKHQNEQEQQTIRQIEKIASESQASQQQPPAPEQQQMIVEEEKKEEDQVMESEPEVVQEQAPATTVVSAPAEEAAAPETPAVQTNLNKCWHCSKKVGLVKVPCKCTYVFCPKHRHAEAHNCTFDYFAENKERLTKLNPQIQHEKMEKLF